MLRLTKPDDLDALLRREGIYSSHLSKWRAAANKGGLNALEPKKRGPVPKVDAQRDRQLAEAERETARWRKRAERAEAIVDLQKKSPRSWGFISPRAKRVANAGCH